MISLLPFHNNKENIFLSNYLHNLCKDSSLNMVIMLQILKLKNLSILTKISKEDNILLHLIQTAIILRKEHPSFRQIKYSILNKSLKENYKDNNM